MHSFRRLRTRKPTALKAKERFSKPQDGREAEQAMEETGGVEML